MGLEGESPESIDPKSINRRIDLIKQCGSLSLMGKHSVQFAIPRDLRFRRHQCLPQHPNGMRFCAFDTDGNLLATNEYFSIGGGFVVNERTRLSHGDNAFYKPEHVNAEDQPQPHDSDDRVKQDQLSAAIPFTNAADLIEKCRQRQLSIAQLVLENELHWQPDRQQVRNGVLRLWQVMAESIRNGIDATGQQYLPGELRVKRRAPGIYEKLKLANGSDRLTALDWLSLYAIAVNEENAAGGRVVTAPTNGAAGIIPAVLKYYLEFLCPNQQMGDHKIVEFLLTAAAIGMLYKRGSSISAAEVGCQGEIGVACSMASAGLCAVMGGTLDQVENAAEIGMEHNLGLTCDPVGGMVQIPCIERNALGAVKAVTAAQLSLNGDGTHRVSLDQVIETMRQTGHDMQVKYKETSLGGLAVNVPLC
jgi:iron-sulfur-dependent L-serine dehydratase single chain form